MKLLKRVKEGELVICKTDKSQKLAVLSTEEYLRVGREHTEKDIEITVEEVDEIQDDVNNHCSMLIKIFQIGEDWGHQSRHREMRINHSATPSSMYMLIKDHKQGRVRGRPVNGPGLNTNLSDIISDVVEPIANAMNNDSEMMSTEDMMAHFDKYNEQVDLIRNGALGHHYT